MIVVDALLCKTSRCGWSLSQVKIGLGQNIDSWLLPRVPFDWSFPGLLSRKLQVSRRQTAIPRHQATIGPFGGIHHHDLAMSQPSGLSALEILAAINQPFDNATVLTHALVDQEARKV